MGDTYRRRIAAAAWASLAVGALSAAPQAMATTKSLKAAKHACAKIPASSVSKLAGTTVKHVEVRDSLALPVGDHTLGFECGYYPAHFSEAFPTSEPVVFANVSRTRGTTKKLHHLATAFPLYGGTETKVSGIGSAAYVSVGTTGPNPGELPEVVVYVLKGHTIFYADSREIPQSAVEAFAKLVAAKL